MFVKRLLDISASAAAIVVLSLPMLLIGLIVKLTSKGPVLYWSDRIGKNNIIFRMPKFRTMRTDTPPVATHLFKNSGRAITPAGRRLRKMSLDELPQLFSIIRGDMSLVGPRPALFNQEDLIELRTAKGIHRLVPGLTGWAQINGRDELPIPVKAELDEYYMKNMSLSLDLKILWRTFFKVVKSEGIEH